MGWKLGERGVSVDGWGGGLETGGLSTSSCISPNRLHASQESCCLSFPPSLSLSSSARQMTECGERDYGEEIVGDRGITDSWTLTMHGCAYRMSLQVLLRSRNGHPNVTSRLILKRWPLICCYNRFAPLWTMHFGNWLRFLWHEHWMQFWLTGHIPVPPNGFTGRRGRCRPTEFLQS